MSFPSLFIFSSFHTLSSCNWRFVICPRNRTNRTTIVEGGVADFELTIMVSTPFTLNSSSLEARSRKYGHQNDTSWLSFACTTFKAASAWLQVCFFRSKTTLLSENPNLSWIMFIISTRGRLSTATLSIDSQAPFTPPERIIPDSWHFFRIHESVYTGFDKSGIICCESGKITNPQSKVRTLSGYFVSGILFWCKRTCPDTLSKRLVSRVADYYGFIKTSVNAFMNLETNVTNPWQMALV